MDNQQALEALQNFGNTLNLKIVEEFAHDKRKTVKKYFAINKEGTKSSPVLDYNGMNHFMLGWHNATIK